MDRPLRLELGDEVVPLAGDVRCLRRELLRPGAGFFDHRLEPCDEGVSFRQRRLEPGGGLVRQADVIWTMTAAHRTLPFGSKVRVTNPANGRSVVVRINDRGPFHPGRLMDLSYAAAHRLGFASKGSAEVSVEAVQAGSDAAQPADGTAVAGAQPIPTQAAPRTTVRAERAATRIKRAPAAGANELWLQLGAFSSRDNAESLRQSVAGRLPELAPGLALLEINGRWRLRVGPLYDREAMDYVRDILRESLGINALPVKP